MEEIITDIEAIAKALLEKKDEKKSTLFLCSRASALFKSKVIYNDLQKMSMKYFESMTVLEQFQECCAVLKEERNKNGLNDMRLFLMDAIQPVSYEIEDSNLAELIKQNLFHSIFTLNMKDILEAALIAKEMARYQDFVDFSLGERPLEETVRTILDFERPNIPKIIKFYKDEQAFLNGLEDPLSSKEKYACIRRLLEKKKIKEIFIVGWDQVWDELLISAFPATINKVWLIHEDIETKKKFIEQYSRCEQLYTLRGSYKSFCMDLLRYLFPETHTQNEQLHTIIFMLEKLARQIEDSASSASPKTSNVGHNDAYEQKLQEMDKQLINMQKDMIAVQRDLLDIKRLLMDKMN